MKRNIVTLAVSALLALPAAASAETNGDVFLQRKAQVAMFPSLRAIPPAVKRMVMPKADARAQELARSTTEQRDFLW